MWLNNVTTQIFQSLFYFISTLDVNDQSPEFVNVPYIFRVNEGESGAKVGTVEATDKDIDDNAIVYYSIADDQQDSPFDIENLLGMVFQQGVSYWSGIL